MTLKETAFMLKFKDINIPDKKFFLYMLRNMNDGNISQIDTGELSEMGYDENSIKGNISRLEKLGIIKRIVVQNCYFINPSVYCTESPYYQRLFQKEYDSIGRTKFKVFNYGRL